MEFNFLQCFAAGIRQKSNDIRKPGVKENISLITRMIDRGLTLGLLLCVLNGCANIVPRSDMGQCAGVQAPALRLSCYDNLANHLGVGERMNEHAPQRGWHLRTERSSIAGSVNVYLSTPADQTFVAPSGQTVLPTLNLRCKENTTALLVGYGTHLGQGKTQVTYRIDAQPPDREDWLLSTASSSVGLWKGNASIPFVNRLLDAEQLTLEVTPPGSSSVSSTFRVAGLTQAIEPLRTACHW